MATYGYSYRGYTTYGGVTPQTSYSSDHVSQPAAEGWRKPVISYSTPNGNTESYVRTTEIVEHVPLVIGYKHSSPVRVEVKEYYGDGEGKWNRPSSPEKWRRPSSPEKWHRPSSPAGKWNNKPSSPEKWHRPSSPTGKWNNKPSSPEKWRKPSSPVRYRAEEKWVRPSSPVHDRPHEVEEFITKVQTEASRPNNNRFGPVSATQWRQTPNSHHVNTGHGDQNNDYLSNKEWQKPSGNTIRSENYDDGWAKPSYGAAWSKPQGDRDRLSKPINDINTAVEYMKEAVKPSGVVTYKPSHGTWSTPQGGNLGNPTSDINTAVEFLKEVVKPSSGITSHQPYRYSIPVTSTGPKRDSYPEIIDSKEAARRYGNYNFAATRPMDNNYTTTIDSREAARKYGGTTV
ncbi:hypothetical protein COLO4_13630 [Corchorus olitorius]|uniref:Uncharacterized protein n=1 Tax=Corchorus olitorius TaxID=93759 RepID=A0A1R3JVS0_9ROSI|nr:hypothetical protein COLO4_13630 [Corchorus olitorius]